jgi:hypothetical protein
MSLTNLGLLDAIITCIKTKPDSPARPVNYLMIFKFSYTNPFSGSIKAKFEDT